MRDHQFFKMLGRILRHMSRAERITVLFLAAVLIASAARILFPEASFFPKTLGKTVYSEGIIGYPNLLNPVFVDFNEVDRDVSSLIFSGLLKYDPKVKNFIPDLASEIKRGSDDRSYLVTLKKNALWHDKTPLTADDVVFTFQKVIQDPGFKNPALQSAFQNVAVQKVDKETVMFTLNKPNSYFPSYLVAGLLPFHILKEASIAEFEKHPFNRNPIGTGPYKLQMPLFAKNKIDEIALERFEDYYGEKPEFNLVRMSFYKNAEDLLRDKNKFNAIPKITGIDIKTELYDKRFKHTSYILPQYIAVFFNLDNPLLAKKQYRHILMKSIDKTALSQLIMDAAPIDTMAFKRMEKEWIHQFDVKEAETIIKELGYKKGGDGFLRNSKGEILSFTLLAKRFPEKSAIEQKTMLTVSFLKNSWEAVGVKINEKRESGENFVELLKKREYDLLLAGHSMGYNTDSFAFWHSSQASEFGLNFSQLKTFRIDSLLEDLRATFDMDKKRKKLAQLEKEISDAMPALFLYAPSYGFFIDSKIEGMVVDNFAHPADRFANLREVSIK